MRGQVKMALTFILFGLAAAVVLILGYQGVTKLMGQSCDAAKATFTTKIVGMFDRYDDYGSVHRENLRLPCDYQDICFADSSYVEGDDTTDMDPNGPPTQFGAPLRLGANKRQVIQAAASQDRNIFLIGEFAEPIAYSPKVEVSNFTNVLCVTSRGGVNLEFRGQGRNTLVLEG